MLDCCSNGNGGNSVDLTHGQFEPQPANLVADSEAFVRLQQLCLEETALLLQQDLAIAEELALRHWQLPLLLQLPQHAFAIVTVRQLCEPQEVPQSDTWPSTLLNIVSTSKPAIVGRGMIIIIQAMGRFAVLIIGQAKS